MRPFLAPAILLIAALLSGCIGASQTTVTEREIIRETVTVTQTVTSPPTQEPIETPGMAFSQDQSAKTLTVVSADAKADWKNIIVTFPNGCYVKLNDGVLLSSGAPVSQKARPMGAGDYLVINSCRSGPNLMRLTYSPNSSALGQWTFNF
jgi:type IV pilus biogenesis protein CpaD/CtpE